jgi:P4 family phage/plasmid primase-like protien
MYAYSLVGHNRNALIFFFIGNGRDGKSTVMRVNREMLGHDMALLTDSSLLQLTTNPKHARNELASFQNKRLIVFSESASLARLDEDVVKRFTGENVIRAEAKFQDAIEIPVVGHGVLLSQHKPNIYDQSRAIWERLRLIHFNHEYTREVRNPSFYEDVLAAELPGVLRLSVETWLKHQEKKTDYHLIYPEMEKALEEYRNETDYFGQFAEDCLLFEPEGFLPDVALKAVASEWAKDTGTKALEDPSPKYIKKVIGNYVLSRGIKHTVEGGVQRRVDRKLYDINPGTQNIVRGFVGIKLSSSGEGYFKRARREMTRYSMSSLFGS